MTYYPSASDSIFDFWHLVKFTYLLTYLLFVCCSVTAVVVDITRIKVKTTTLILSCSIIDFR